MKPTSFASADDDFQTAPADPRRVRRRAIKQTALLTVLAAASLAPPAARAGEADKWTFDVSLYGLAVGMSGDIGIGAVNADLNVGFDEIWDNLEFAGMGTVRVGYGRWALTTDVIHMDYETGSGTSRFKYDVLNQGPQFWISFHF